MLRLFSLFIIFLTFWSSYAFGSDDLTSPEFTVNLLAMDPVHTSYKDLGLTQWTWALLFILGKVADILLFVVPILAGISLMVAGYYYIFSSGDTEKASQAKTIIKWNIVALLVAFLSYSLVKMVLYILNLL